MTTLMRLGWGQQNAAFRQMFTSLFIPGGTKEQADWFNELQRISISPEMAVRNFEATDEIDVAALLPQVSVPTLVLHARDDALVRFEAGRRMAAGIPAPASSPCRGATTSSSRPSQPLASSWSTLGRSSPPRRLALASELEHEEARCVVCDRAGFKGSNHGMQPAASAAADAER
jgi:hypothetical protein